ncbi:MAG TPA: winged helix-turn-helix domain-containing protein [Candidatus Bathyarchaeia archaeon]|nr:winged helix-turn-helix domain-containing protein [Candidatus Bathyarchaeia archaeon]
MAAKKNIEEINYKDFIEKEPEFIVYMNTEQAKIVESYIPIVSALRKRPMTVKEIHHLYFDKESQKYTFTIKTIYRHLEKLESAGLVRVTGHRVTEGSRVLEKLYSRTGKIFFLKPDEDHLREKKEYVKQFTSNLFVLMREYYKKADLPEDIFCNLINDFKVREYKHIDSLMDFIATNSNLTELYGKMDIDMINLLNSFSAILIAILAKPEVIDELKNLLL